ncbi:MAG: Hsp20/alpha crystallin family protein [Armatimonadota bacterium]
MSLARWEPFSELRRMREDMDRLFGSMWQPGAMMEGVVPAIDVYEKDNNIMVKAEVPGLKKEDLEITATEDGITIRGEFRKEEEAREEGYVRRERRFGKFYRTIPMPTMIKPDEVKASFKDGVLEVTAPKSEEQKAKEKRVTVE